MDYASLGDMNPRIDLMTKMSPDEIKYTQNDMGRIYEVQNIVSESYPANKKKQMENSSKQLKIRNQEKSIKANAFAMSNS